MSALGNEYLLLSRQKLAGQLLEQSTTPFDRGVNVTEVTNMVVAAYYYCVGYDYVVTQRAAWQLVLQLDGEELTVEYWEGLRAALRELGEALDNGLR